MMLQAFLDGVLENAARVKEYKLGMDGRNGQCDCIGLIIGGIRLAGGVWSGTHGTNYAARNEMQSLEKIPSAGALKVGDLVYKAHAPGQSGYNLPSAYKNSPDQRDYYHVGVVERVDPLVILHCTSVPGGIKRDTALGNWAYYGLWKGIGEEGAFQPYQVIGGQLKMRSGPGTNYAVVAYLPNGTRVSARKIAGNQDWLQVQYNGQTGYCMARYLEPADAAAQEDALEKVAALLEEALQLVNQLRQAG